MNEKKRFPPIKPDLHETEVLAKPSVDVLVLFKNFNHPMIGRYFHGADFWQADNVHGELTAVEWWPLPESGTGTKV